MLHNFYKFRTIPEMNFDCAPDRTGNTLNLADVRLLWDFKTWKVKTLKTWFTTRDHQMYCLHFSLKIEFIEGRKKWTGNHIYRKYISDFSNSNEKDIWSTCSNICLIKLQSNESLNLIVGSYKTLWIPKKRHIGFVKANR